MAGRDLKLQVVFAALDKITGPLKKIMGGSSDTAKALKATSDRLRELNTQQRNLGKFRELHSGIRTTGVELKEAQKKVKELSASIKQTESPTRAMTRDLKAATKVTQALTLKGREQSQQFRVLRTSLKDAGIDTRQLGKAQEWLKNSIQLTNVELASQQKRLAASAAKQQRVTNATQHADKLRNKAGNLAMAGAGATATGAVIGAPVVKGLNEAKHYQTEVGRVNALGLGDKVSAEAVAFARNMKTYGTSQLDNLQLMRDGMSAFADVHHAEMVAPTLAKMKFANHAFFGEAEGADNERKFMDMLKVIELRGGLESKEKFEAQANIVQQVITATGGRVGPNEWLNMIKTGGIAAKGLKDDAFYYQMEPLVQEMSGNRVGTSLMSAYQNLYQGRTTKRSARKLEEFGLIGDKSKVKHDKAGQVSFLDPGALLGAELFRENQFEWLEKVLLPQLAKKGITEKKQVLDAIGSIFSNRTASNLYSQMYLQRVQIHKNEKLNRGAADIGKLEKLGRDSAAGKELEAQSKLANLKLTMGEKILPLYAQGLEMAISAVQRLNSFMERNPTVAKVMIAGFAVLAGLLLVLGPLMLGIAAMIGPYAMLHVMFAKMGVTGGVLTPILRSLGGAFMWTGRAVLWLGRALMLNPIGIAITVIAGAAFLIYKYWEPIKGFFGGLWSDVKAAFSGGFTGINSLIADWSPLGLFYRAFAGVLGWFGVALPARFTDFAASIRGSLAKGLAPLAGFFTGAWSHIKTAFAGGIGGVSALIANWSPLGLFYRAFAGVLGWFGIVLPAKFTDFGASILQRITASWAPISAFFADIWSGLRTVCAGGMGSITALIINWSPVGMFYQAFAGVMSWFGIKLPAQFTEFGANILRGLVNGITGSMGAVKDAISNAGSSTIAWFKEKLGIHSPSRVFAQLGDYTMQGLAMGLERSEGASITQVSSLAKRLTQIGASIAIGAAVGPAAALNAQPSVDAPATGNDALRQVSVLARQLAQINAVPAPAAPLDARPLVTPAPGNDALRQLTGLARQREQIKVAPATAMPLDARPLVTPAPGNDVLRLVIGQARQREQIRVVPAPAAPLDARPLATPAPGSDALRLISELAHQMAQINAAPAPAAPFDARPLIAPAPGNDALRQVTGLAWQREQIKVAPAPAMPLDARPLVTPAPGNDVLRLVTGLARQREQIKVVPAKAAPLDARPLATPTPGSDALRQVTELAHQMAPINAAPAPGVPPDARLQVTPAAGNDTLRQVNVLVRQLAQINAAPAPAAPLDARPLVTPVPGNDVLRQVTGLAHQWEHVKVAPAPAMPLDARPLVTPAPGNDVLRLVTGLARQRDQIKVAPAPAVPLDARPLVTPAPSNEVLRQVSGLARQLAQLGAGIHIDDGGATPAIAFDTRPPVTARSQAASYDSHDTIQIHIATAPGMDAQAIARAVNAALDQRDREKAARIRSSLRDHD